MCFVHRLVRQHGLAHDVANGEDVRHVGAHLDVHVDKATVRHGHAGFVGGKFFAVGRAAHGLEHQIVDLRCRSGAAGFGAFERDFNAFGQGACGHGLGFEQLQVKALGVHLLPDLDQVAVRALHEAIHHFHHIEARAQRAVNRAHFQADDAATQNQHAFGHFFEFQSARAVNHAGIVGHERQTHGLRTRSNDGLLEGDHFFAAVLFLRGAGGLRHFEVVGTHELAQAAHGGDLAHLGHGRQAACEFADDFFFVAAQLVDVDHRLAEVHTEVGHVADFVHHRCDVQQGFGRNATHVQTHAAQGGVALNDDHVQAEVGRAERCRITAGATAQDEHVALDVGHPCMVLAEG